jgi:hypothetical protein
VEDKDLLNQIAALRKLRVSGLRERYREVFGEDTASRNKTYLFKRIAYRIQEQKYGGLSDRAKKRAAELAKDAPIRRGRLKIDTAAPERDPRLPAPGTLLTRTFAKRDHVVKVLKNGFEYEGKPYRSLSAIAKEITKTAWNGFGFFGLLAKEKA